MLIIIDFNNIFKKPMDQNQEYEGIKHKQNALTYKKQLNVITWEIKNLEKLLAKIDKNFK